MATITKESTIKRAHYKCAECKSEDFYKYFSDVTNDPYPASIPCWKCKNGFNCAGKGNRPGMQLVGVGD